MTDFVCTKCGKRLVKGLFGSFKDNCGHNSYVEVDYDKPLVVQEYT